MILVSPLHTYLRKLTSTGYKLTFHHFLHLSLNIDYLDEHGFLQKLKEEKSSKKQYTVREILYYLVYEYNSKPNHENNQYFGCFRHGFRKNVQPWKNPEMQYYSGYYPSREPMNNRGIRKLLKSYPIQLNTNNSNKLHEGYHRVFAVMGHFVKKGEYLPLFTRRPATPPQPVPNVGYRLKHNAHRLKWILDEIKRDGGQKFSLMDIGSNFGFFSSSVAFNFPLARIISVEGSVGTGNENSPDSVLKTKGIRTHLDIIQSHCLSNNVLIPKSIDLRDIQKIRKQGICLDYQISFSVLHWIALVSKTISIPEIKDLIFQHICCAKTTFLELPAVTQDTTLSPIYKEYNENIDTMLHKVFQERGETIRIKKLGRLKYYGYRDTWRVDRRSANPSEPELYSTHYLKALFNSTQALSAP